MKLEAAMQESMCGVVDKEVPLKKPETRDRRALGFKREFNWEVGVGGAGAVAWEFVLFLF